MDVQGIRFISLFCHSERKQVYLVTTALLIAGIYGMSLMHTTEI